MRLEYEVPMHLPSCANLREHWRVRAKRTQAQRLTGKMYAYHWVPAHFVLKPSFRNVKMRITLTRISPRKLDSDNVASAFKAFRDGIADALEVNDGSDLIEWQYAQEKGGTRVKVEIETL